LKELITYNFLCIDNHFIIKDLKGIRRLLKEAHNLAKSISGKQVSTNTLAQELGYCTSHRSF